MVTKVTESKPYSCKILNSYGIMTDEHTTLFSKGLTNRSNLLLNILRLVHLRILRSGLFHSDGSSNNAPSWIKDFVLLLNHGGSFSSHTIVSWGIKFFIMFNIVVLKTVTYSSTFKFHKALFQLNSWIARLIRMESASW